MDHFKWEQKDRYISQFFKLNNEIQSLVNELKFDFEKLKKFKSNLVSKGFSGFVDELCSDCGVFELNPNLRNDLEISGTQLIGGVRDIF